MKADKRRLREAAHHEHERLAFDIRPWQVFPYAAVGQPPAATDSPRAQSWARAREIRDQLLAEDPHHYDDIGG